MTRPLRLLGLLLCSARLATGIWHAGATNVNILGRALTTMSILGTSDDAEQAMQELDKDKNGFVELNEISAFASNKGLDYAATVKEFANFDKDHDGKLDVTELAGVLGLALPSQSDGSGAAVLRNKGPSDALAGLETGSAGGLSGEERVAVVSSIAAELAREVSLSRESQDLALQAAQTRSQLALLQRRIAQQVLEASSSAAASKAEDLAKNLTSLENDALRTEVKAAAVRAKMEADVKQVNDMSSIVKEGLTSLRHSN